MIYKLRTVDVWDTLLRRDCHPECIKLATAQHLFLGHVHRLRAEYRDCWTLYSARVDAERSLAEEAREQGDDDEYEITLVLRRWLDVVCRDAIDTDLPLQLAEFELQTEISRTFVDTGIVEFLSRHQAERTVFLSDFYMNSAMLRRLLSAKEVNRLVDDGIASCDVGVNKRSGQLFRHVHKLHRVAPEEHIHVGDNLWSDVEVPRSLGITALHYAPEAAHAERLERERLFSTREALFEQVRRECAATARRASDGLSARKAAAFRLGVEVAPLFIGFALWVAEQAVVKKLDRLYFFTREGEFFSHVYQTIFPEEIYFGHQLPPSDVLAVSRLATFSASMENVSIEEMSRIWALFKSQTVSGLFATLGLDYSNFVDVLNSLGLKSDELVDDPSNHPGIKKLFQNEAFVSAAEGTLSHQKQAVLEYLEQKKIYLHEKIGVVDIGWRGTIQDNLALLKPQTHFCGLYLGLRRMINSQPANVSKSAYGPNENQSLEFASLFECFAVMEMLCNSPNGSVVGYSRKDGDVIPQRQFVTSENEYFEEFTKHFQQGVLLAAGIWQPYIERYVVTGAELRDVSMQIWEYLRIAPASELAEVFMQTPQHDVFGFGDIFQRNQLPSVSTILLAPIIKSKRRQLIEFVRRVQWSAAIDQAQGVGRFHRGILQLTFRFANFIKRSRMKSQMARRNENN